MRLFRSMLFPHLVEAEKIFGSRVAKLNLPGGIKITHHPFFESPDYKMEIAFRDGKDLTEKIKYLKEIKELEKLADPWVKMENGSK
jgi:hypothetical protein